MRVIKEIKATAISPRQKKKTMFWSHLLLFINHESLVVQCLDWCSLCKRGSALLHIKRNVGEIKKYLNEISAPIYLGDVLAFVVFKYRGYFHVLCCLMNSLRDCDLSFKQQKWKNSFLSWKKIKWAETRKAPFVLIFQTSKHISIHENMDLNPLQIKRMHFIYLSKDEF